jgi:hypothetical protein
MAKWRAKISGRLEAKPVSVQSPPFTAEGEGKTKREAVGKAKKGVEKQINSVFGSRARQGVTRIRWSGRSVSKED